MRWCRLLYSINLSLPLKSYAKGTGNIQKPPRNTEAVLKSTDMRNNTAADKLVDKFLAVQRSAVECAL